VAIRDLDCDVELPDLHSPSSHDFSGFVAILRLRGILGAILDTVAAVKKVKEYRQISKFSKIRMKVSELNSELQAWATSAVPPHIKGAEKGRLNVEKLIALSSYFSALMLLYRYLVSNPHRPSPLDGGEAEAQCARAATNCIRLTAQVIESLPICPELIFHGQHVFTSAMVLLHCIRRSGNDTVFIRTVLKDVELASQSLRSLQHLWSGAKKLMGLLENYLELILKCLEKGLDARRCIFHHDTHEHTGLEWKDDVVQDFSCPVHNNNSIAFDFTSLLGPVAGNDFAPQFSHIASADAVTTDNLGGTQPTPFEGEGDVHGRGGVRGGGAYIARPLSTNSSPGYDILGFDAGLWGSNLQCSGYR
jgi:hypothetical protein